MFFISFSSFNSDNIFSTGFSIIVSPDKELFKIFEDSGMPEDTIIAIFSDHGDEHLEHGNYTHGYSLYEEVVRVLLMIYDDGTGYIDERVQLLDLVPHIFNILGIKKTKYLMGHRLAEPEYIFMETAFKNPHHKYVILRGIVWRNYKFIYNESLSKFELYDLSIDPYERNDLSRKEQSLVKNFVDMLNSIKVRNKRIELSIKLNTLFNY